MRTRWFGVLAVALAAAILAGTVQAQPGQGRGRGGFGFGGRGPGGGAGIAGLIMIPAIQKEIELTDDQRESLTAALQKAREEMRPEGEGRGGRPNFREMSEQEREKAMEEMRARFEESRKKMEGIVKEELLPPQVDRLNEIRIQQMGVRALLDSEIAKALDLSNKQQEKIQEALDAPREAMEKEREKIMGGERPNFREMSQEDREKMMRQFQELREKGQELSEKAEKNAVAVLNPPQKKKFDDMKGDPFEMPEPQFGGRGPGGRRPGAGGPGGRGPGGRGPGGQGGRPQRPGA